MQKLGEVGHKVRRRHHAPGLVREVEDALWETDLVHVRYDEVPVGELGAVDRTAVGARLADGLLAVARQRHALRQLRLAEAAHRAVHLSQDQQVVCLGAAAADLGDERDALGARRQLAEELPHKELLVYLGPLSDALLLERVVVHLDDKFLHDAQVIAAGELEPQIRLRRGELLVVLLDVALGGIADLADVHRRERQPDLATQQLLRALPYLATDLEQRVRWQQHLVLLRKLREVRDEDAVAAADQEDGALDLCAGASLQELLHNAVRRRRRAECRPAHERHCGVCRLEVDVEATVQLRYEKVVLGELLERLRDVVDERTEALDALGVAHTERVVHVAVDLCLQSVDVKPDRGVSRDVGVLGSHPAGLEVLPELGALLEDVLLRGVLEHLTAADAVEVLHRRLVAALELRQQLRQSWVL
eukprot:PhM_4_TR15947/c0_g2_i1/m.50120